MDPSTGGGVAVPPPLSHVVVPNGLRKRRHSLIEDSPSAHRTKGGNGRGKHESASVSSAVVTGDSRVAVDCAEGVGVSARAATESSGDDGGLEREEDEDGDGEEEEEEEGDEEITSSIEDLVEQAEMDPYAAFLETELSLDLAEKKRLRARLLEIGPEPFLIEQLEQGEMDMRLLGTAFGLDPLRTFRHDDARYFHVLQITIHRTFTKRRKLEHFNTIDDAAELLKKSSKIMVITGAGISTSLGIPDFRSKEGGFYTMLLKEGYDDPEAVFDIETFDLDPRLFYKLAGNILPDMKRFSPTHAFIRLLQDKGKLQRNYSQNIDALEQAAGIRNELLVQCHGSFATATCRRDPTHKVNGTDIFPHIKAQQVAYCERCKVALTERAKSRKKKPVNDDRKRHAFDDSDEDSSDDIAPGVLKPDITFFGEQLPDNFFHLFTSKDADVVDLVIVIGTSLKVAPVSDMPDHLPVHVPHIYISREPISHVNFDIQLLGNCDDVVYELCRRVGWTLKHEMIPPHLRLRIEPHEDSRHRWKIQARPPKDPLVGPRLDVPRSDHTPSRTPSPNGKISTLSRALKDSISRDSSPIRKSAALLQPPEKASSRNSSPIRPEPVRSQSVPTSGPSLVLSPAKPIFRPIPGSPSRPPASIPTPPPLPSAALQRPIPGSPLRRPTPTPPSPQPYRPIPGSPSRPDRLAVPPQRSSLSPAPRGPVGVEGLAAAGVTKTGPVVSGSSELEVAGRAGTPSNGFKRVRVQSDDHIQ